MLFRGRAIIKITNHFDDFEASVLRIIIHAAKSSTGRGGVSIDRGSKRHSPFRG